MRSDTLKSTTPMPLRRPLVGKAGLLALLAALLLTACGGGGGYYMYPNQPYGSSAFDVVAYVNGQSVPGFDVFPGSAQALSVSVNQTIEFDSSGPVYWQIMVNGVVVPPANNIISVGPVNIQESVSTPGQLIIDPSSYYPLTGPVYVSVLATSQVDQTQTAEMDLTITN